MRHADTPANVCFVDDDVCFRFDSLAKALRFLATVAGAERRGLAWIETLAATTTSERRDGSPPGERYAVSLVEDNPDAVDRRRAIDRFVNFQNIQRLQVLAASELSDFDRVAILGFLEEARNIMFDEMNRRCLSAGYELQGSSPVGHLPGLDRH